MLYANLNGAKILATPRAKAWCPGCGSQVIAKCGEILIWHWAHESRAECDPWHECESAWHLDWKSLFPPDQCEVVMGEHRADIVGKGGMAIELQHSSLTPAQVRERETFYRPGMLWIVDASEFEERITFLESRRAPKYQRFHWERPRQWMFHMMKSVYFDFSDGGFLCIEKFHPIMGGEWLSVTDGTYFGQWVNKRDFIRKIGGSFRDDQGMVTAVSGAAQNQKSAVGLAQSG